MDLKIYNSLKKLAAVLPLPLYVVGGYVRNYLICKDYTTDIDISSPLKAEDIILGAKKVGLKVVATYKRTGTVVLSDGVNKFEYTSFREDNYGKGGAHTPKNVVFTSDILLDAKRRDFKCNAVYYDILNRKIVDPLNGVSDIKNKVLDCVVNPKKVFSSDGLRLMRLCRFYGELGFTPTKEVIESAKENADKINGISSERISDELNKILVADTKYTFSPENGHYLGIKLLEEIGVLDKIIGELTLGKNMPQRPDYHKYDVLEHSLLTVFYSDKSIRLPALLHDIGKPYCMINFGNFHSHNTYGKDICVKLLKRLKTDKKTVEKVKFLTSEHMFDLDCKTSEKKVRRFIVENYDKIDDLLLLKQADYSACKDDLTVAPTVNRWNKIIENMKKDGTPFNLSMLKISANELIAMGFKGEEIGKTLKKLFFLAVDNPKLNDKKTLLNYINTSKNI